MTASVKFMNYELPGDPASIEKRKTEGFLQTEINLLRDLGLLELSSGATKPVGGIAPSEIGAFLNWLAQNKPGEMPPVAKRILCSRLQRMKTEKSLSPASKQFAAGEIVPQLELLVGDCAGVEPIVKTESKPAVSAPLRGSSGLSLPELLKALQPLETKLKAHIDTKFAAHKGEMEALKGDIRTQLQALPKLETAIEAIVKQIGELKRNISFQNDENEETHARLNAELAMLENSQNALSQIPASRSSTMSSLPASRSSTMSSFSSNSSPPPVGGAPQLSNKQGIKVAQSRPPLVAVRSNASAQLGAAGQGTSRSLIQTTESAAPSPQRNNRTRKNAPTPQPQKSAPPLIAVPNNASNTKAQLQRAGTGASRTLIPARNQTRRRTANEHGIELQEISKNSAKPNQTGARNEKPRRFNVTTYGRSLYNRLSTRRNAPKTNNPAPITTRASQPNVEEGIEMQENPMRARLGAKNPNATTQTRKRSFLNRITPANSTVRAFSNAAGAIGRSAGMVTDPFAQMLGSLST